MKLYEKYCFSWGKKLVKLQYVISHVPWSVVSVRPTQILFIIHKKTLQKHFTWNFIVQENNDFEKCSKKRPYVPKNLANDLFGDFVWQNFSTFSVKRVRLKYFGKLFIDLIEFHTSNEIALSSYFLSSKNAVSDRFCHLKIWWGLIYHICLT